MTAGLPPQAPHPKPPIEISSAPMSDSASSKPPSERPTRIRVEDDRTGMDPVVLRRAFTDHVQFSRARDFRVATAFDRYISLALSVRDRLVQRWAATAHAYTEKDVKRAYYLSAEFLLGRALTANMQALGIQEELRAVLADLGIDLDKLIDQEPDAGLGNGGLGRLAACILESLATLGMPGYGYGIRYEFGIFEQVIRDGYQVERADEWLRFGNPWEVERPEYAVLVSFGGSVEHTHDGRSGFRAIWHPAEQILGVPYDTPIAGYGSNTMNSSASGPRARARSSISACSTRATTCAPSRRRTRPRSCRRCSTRTTTSPQGKSCASARSTSSSRARSTTSCGATGNIGQTSRASRRRSRSSSTTRTRRSRSRS
jgi:hypothetical protein